jgi:hypothetical protein
MRFVASAEQGGCDEHDNGVGYFPVVFIILDYDTGPTLSAGSGGVGEPCKYNIATLEIHLLISS